MDDEIIEILNRRKRRVADKQKEVDLLIEELGDQIDEANRRYKLGIPSILSYKSDRVETNMPKNPKSESWRDRTKRMLVALDSACRACSICELGRRMAHDGHPTTRMEFDPHVFSNCNPSKFVIVGQNPGREECLRGEPFMGPSGRRFNDTISKFGCSRDDFYICNIVRCHTQGNVKPSAEHKRRCESFLRMELLLLRPKLVVCLGSVSFSSLCPGLNLTSNLGNIVHSKSFDVNVYPIYHPSPLNLNDKSKLDKFEDDIRKLCKIVNAYK